MRTTTEGSGAAGGKGRRIALYSHDTVGIGHMRRNLLIARALAGSCPGTVILLIAGAREAAAFSLPPGTDCLTLPALSKEDSGAYQPRCLGLPVEQLVGLRGGAIRAALEAFEPDVLIVDKVPRGALGELGPVLDFLRERGRARCVLGLREVLDEPAVVDREWRSTGSEEAVRAHYDAVWVYGDPTVYDPVREYGFSATVAARVRYTGYLGCLDQRLPLPVSPSAGPVDDLELPPGPLVLCTVGGGQDGAALAEAFAAADLPRGAVGLILTGPFMPPNVRERLLRRAARQPRLRVLPFVAEPARLLGRADRVIAMGGYNTVCEVLSFAKRSLIVPRVRPRREQIIRAERLRDLGLLDLLHPDAVGPQALTEWLARDLPPLASVRDRVDLDGLARLPRLLEDLLAAPPAVAAPSLWGRGGYHADLTQRDEAVAALPALARPQGV